jgi:hypothetical protein
MFGQSFLLNLLVNSIRSKWFWMGKLQSPCTILRFLLGLGLLEVMILDANEIAHCFVPLCPQLPIGGEEHSPSYGLAILCLIGLS